LPRCWRPWRSVGDAETRFHGGGEGENSPRFGAETLDMVWRQMSEMRRTWVADEPLWTRTQE
jgi:hypothetical protein